VVHYSETNFAPATTIIYRSAFERLVESAGDKLVALVTVRDVEEFKRRRSEKVSRVTINKELRTLRSGFNLGRELGYANDNPFKSARLLRVPEIEPEHLSIDEFQRLLVVIDDPDTATLVEFAVLTMLRRSEIVNLKWEDVDLARRVVHIKNRAEFTVKGMKPRPVPLSERAICILVTRTRDGCYVFPGADGKRLNGGSLSRRFKKYARKCGLPDGIHFHSLRHTGASWLVQSGVPLYSVQKILGHSSPLVTQIYSHLAEEHLREAVERIGGLTLNPHHAGERRDIHLN
jgi:integrase